MYKRLIYNSRILYLIVAFSFLGYYAILLMVHNAGMGSNSRLFTIPLRLIISALFIILIFQNIRQLKSPWELRVFNIFSIVYIGRMFLDEINNTPYFMPLIAVLAYYLSFVYIPFNSVSSLRFNPKYNKIMFKALAFTGLLFSFLVIVFYSRFIGSTHRLSTTFEEDILSPLALSYCSAMVLGTFPISLYNMKFSKLYKVIIALTFGLSFVPLFLGASRGSFFAIFIPYTILLIAKNNFKHIVIGFILLIIFISILYNLQDYLGSALFDRFLNIESDIESSNASAARVVIWETAFNQFLDSPIIGDKMNVDKFGGYAHNIVLEVLQSTGIIGFIPLLILIIKGFKIAYKIFKNHMEYAWIAIIFIQSFTKALFSGAVWSATWLFLSLGLLIIINNFLTENSLNKNRTRY